MDLPLYHKAPQDKRYQMLAVQRWMLEIDQDQIMSYTVEDKQFWINAVNAAMKACRLAQTH